MDKKPEITYQDFEKVDIRLGRIVKVENFPEAHRPAYKLTIDLGDELGIKKSSAQLVGAHKKEELIGMLVMCVVNFAPKQVGPFKSEVLTLGFANKAGEGFVLATPAKKDVELGDKLK
jgi:tRNA-binding protein